MTPNNHVATRISGTSHLSHRGEPRPAIDLEAARRFLAALDPTAQRFHFTTIPDAGRSGPTSGRYARFDDIAPDLVRANERGEAIYVTVNCTDGIGRKKENIVAVRAVFGDFDDGWPDWWPPPLDPTAMIRTSIKGRVEKVQAYWLLAAGEVLTFERFDRIQRHIVDDWDADRNARDLARILRVPGFLHQKDPANPHLVLFVGGSRRRYTARQIIDAFVWEPEAPPPPACAPVTPLRRGPAAGPAGDRRQAAYAASTLDREVTTLAAMTADSGRTVAAFKLASRIGRWVHHGIFDRAHVVAAIVAASEANGVVRKKGRATVLKQIENGLRLAENDPLPDLGPSGRSFDRRAAA